MRRGISVGVVVALAVAIAAAVGGSKGTLYVYFRSKAELFEAVIRQFGEGETSPQKCRTAAAWTRS